MLLNFLALETGAIAGIAFVSAVIGVAALAIIVGIIKSVGRRKAMRALAESEGWSFAAGDKDVARCLSQCPHLTRAPRNLLAFRRGELAVTFGDIAAGRAQKRNSRSGPSTSRAASFCQVEGAGLAAPTMSLLRKPEIPPQLAKALGSLANFDVETLMGAASIALPDDSEGFSKDFFIEGADTEAVRAYLSRERREALRPVLGEHPLIALRENALVLVSQEPIAPEQVRGFCEKARALFAALA